MNQCSQCQYAIGVVGFMNLQILHSVKGAGKQDIGNVIRITFHVTRYPTFDCPALGVQIP